MILQELVAYYDRKHALPDSDIAPPGWIQRPVDYVVVLDHSGVCVNLVTHFRQEGVKRIARPMLLPSIGKQALKHTNSGKDANLLWDNASFALGTTERGRDKLGCFLAEIERRFPSSDDAGLVALRRFGASLLADPGLLPTLLSRFSAQEDFDKRDPVIAFALVDDEPQPIHRRPAVQAAYEASLGQKDPQATRGMCLVTGANDTPLADNETVIKGVWNAQTAGANIVSFNARSFESYGKEHRQARNAPVSRVASFAYSTALNQLLAPGSRNRVQVGDASTVFWADRASKFDSAFTLADVFGETKDDPDRSRAAVAALFDAVQSGKLASEEGDARFFVLGLAPNAARISVRFWFGGLPLRELAPRILQHFEDIRITPRFDSDPPTPSLFRLLSSVALLGKLDNVPPQLAGEWMRAILAGLPYPALLLNAAVSRCKAEQEVTYLRAAVLKACLNRAHRRRHPPPDGADDNQRRAALTQQYFKETLDMSQTDPAYLLGRLFATLERVQEQAQPGINATIRDRYYGAASTTPVAVFTTLLRLKNAHLKKLPERQAGYFEKLIGEIASAFAAEGRTTFPRQLTLSQQGSFAIGYYQQRQDFYTKKQHTEEPATAALNVTEGA
jgi:CRISPR-associated protein Csd1